MARKIKKWNYDRPRKWSKWDALYQRVRDQIRREDAIGGYEGYLQSAHWQKMRAAILKRDKYRCRDCGSDRHLQVHHLTYERVGRERFRDLMTLCEPCHKKRHAKPAYT